ncbi:hypothetical protein AB2D20_32785, partial [Pseudomonas aeruginosa]
TGIGDLQGQAFRIAHMGHVNAPMILGTLGVVEVALTASTPVASTYPGSNAAAPSSPTRSRMSSPASWANRSRPRSPNRREKDCRRRPSISSGAS